MELVVDEMNKKRHHSVVEKSQGIQNAFIQMDPVKENREKFLLSRHSAAA